jgi:indole-3-glycerol phosphate synthase
VHDEEELDRAVRPARTIGINNRDLKTFKSILPPPSGWRVDCDQSRDSSAFVVLRAAYAVLRMWRVLRASGARAILVGESLLRSGAEGLREGRELLR